MSGGDRAVRIWLYVICALVFIMVMVGGATRLTDSGLSITEWKPIMGAIPPLSAADWQDAFAKYKQIPEYSEINQGMSLSAFKVIFWWEWGHRFLGRLVGVIFLLPLLYFWLRGMIAPGLMPRLVFLFVLGALQGVLGWYMVMSGLVDRVDVSQYRLAAHLGLAVLIFGYGFWLALGLGERTGAGTGERAHLRSRGLQLSAFGLVALIFVQIILGAFVAGLDAGLSHNSWPLMDGEFIPDGLGIMSPWYVNLFENVLTVQFDHRMAAYGLLVWVLLHFFMVRQTPELIDIPTGVRILGGIIFVQIVLGIATLLMHVPISLALLHQAAAIATFAAGIYHFWRLSDLSSHAAVPMGETVTGQAPPV